METRRFQSEQGQRPEEYQEKLLAKNSGLILAVSEKLEGLMRREIADPLEFSDVYRSEDIKEELRRVKEIMDKIRARAREKSSLEKLAFATEGLVYRQIGVSGWLATEGVKVYAEKTTRPDDVLRGTDMVLEFDAGDGSEPLALSFDLTISSIGISEKIHKIKQAIDAGELPDVKYHIHQPDDTHQALEQPARVITGLTCEAAVDLAKTWDNGGDKALRDHPIQLAIARQIALQIQAYEKYARENNRAVLADKYRRVGKIIAKVLAAKEAQFKDAPEESTEDSLREIRLGLTSKLQRAELSKEPPGGRQRSDALRKYR